MKKQTLIAGMYGKFKPKPVYPPEQIRRETAQYLVGVFLWTSFCLFAAGAIALWIPQSEFFLELDPQIPYFIAVLIPMLFILTIRWTIKPASVAHLCCFLYWCASGFALSMLFWIYFGLAIAPFFFAAATSFLLFSIHQLHGKRPLQLRDASIAGFIGGLLTAACFAPFGITLLDALWISLGSFGAMFCIKESMEILQRENKIGNAGRKEEMLERIHGSLFIYILFLFVFAHLLEIFKYARPVKRSSRSSKSSARWRKSGKW